MGYRREEGAGAGASPRVRRIRRILWAILVLNLAVAVAKMAWGYVTGSVAMQADGFHSLFDGASNVVGLVGMYVAGRPADREHPYGHGKFETYASAAIGAMLALAAYRVGSSAIHALVDGGAPPRVDAVSFGIMIGTLAVNIGVTTYERRVGRKLGSEILVADASHTGSDVLVSLGVIAGLVAVRLGFPIADPIIALGVSVAIAYTAWAVFRQANETLSDSARIDPGEICGAACLVEGVLGCHSVRTRGSESEVYVDLHIQVDPSSTVKEGHAVAEEVERAVCVAFPSVVDVIAHLEPLDEYQASKTAEEIDAGLV
ncbi:MAG: cation diffusion facilitator family transporter [Actinomycetota bacterium]|nr:cation diffusion facilitator family transporter [Actinomycetota bacterium]